jgi:hypothetical protein
MRPIMRDFSCLYSPLTVAAGLLALNSTAQAQTANGSFSLSSLSTIANTTFSLNTTIGRFNIVFQKEALTTASGCYSYNNAVAADSCANISVNWIVSASSKPHSLALTFTNTASGSFGLIGGILTGSSPAQLYLNYAVDPVSSTTPVMGASLAMAGNNKQGGSSGMPSSSNTYANEYLCSSPNVTCQSAGATAFATVVPSTYAGTAAAWTASSAVTSLSPPRSTLNVSTDVVDGPGSNGSGYNITSLTETFQVPEPVSVSVLGVGAAAAAAARRWRRKRVQPAAREPLKLAA